MNGSNVECVRAFVLEFAMLDHCAFSADNFRDGIGEAGGVAEADVAFEDSHLRGFFSDD